MLRRTPMKRGRKRAYRPKRDRAHELATALAREQHCILCGAHGFSVPAHFPRHRGSGGRWPDPWHPSHWVPLCGGCHDWIDGRTGGQMDDDCARRERDRHLVNVRATVNWWPRWAAE